jgi:hypothetical protein
VPGEQGAGCHDPVQPQVPGQQPRERGDHRPVGPVRLGRVTRRRRTGPSTSATTSLDSLDEPGDDEVMPWIPTGPTDKDGRPWTILTVLRIRRSAR